jgi:hypothetical protein
MVQDPSQLLTDRAASLLGWTPQSWRRVARGYTPAARYLVSNSRDRAFVKIATTPLTAKLLRQESVAYQRVQGIFMPRLIGWSNDDLEPMLIIEDLSEGLWPPPWHRNLVDAVLEQIAAMHSSPADLPKFGDAHRPDAGGWAAVAEDPRPFLNLGLASSNWLVRALPKLVEAEGNCRTEGSSLTHFDLRSDNICATGSGVKFVDWSAACLGNPVLDLGFWLPSLCFEGGPQPDELLPDAPEVAAWISGFFAARAGRADIPDAPLVRHVQREQLRTSLPWVTRALRLNDL